MFGKVITDILLTTTCRAHSLTRLLTDNSITFVCLLSTFYMNFVMVEEAPTSFSPFSLIDCTLLSHFSFDDFIAVAFLDLARDLDALI